ncbi:MAG TPA: hypothetical protein VMX57_00815 [Planctomycetota bacterium]|nr:hypothetical protein [Planctomycetota bacterium]
MTITMQEAVLRFFDDLDEEVSRERLERIAEALRPFFEYLEQQNVASVADLSMEHIETFLVELAPVRLSAARDRRDAWHSVKRFIVWVGRRCGAKDLAAAFGRREEHLRWVLLGK